MTKTEFIQMITEYAKNEVLDHSKKASSELEKEDRNMNEYYAQVGAMNEAEKIFNVIVRSFIEDQQTNPAGGDHRKKGFI